MEEKKTSKELPTEGQMEQFTEDQDVPLLF